MPPGQWGSGGGGGVVVAFVDWMRMRKVQLYLIFCTSCFILGATFTPTDHRVRTGDEPVRRVAMIPYYGENGRLGYVDSNERWLIEPRFDTVSLFDTLGQAYVYGDEGWALIDRRGTTLLTGLRHDLRYGRPSRYHFHQAAGPSDATLRWFALAGGDSVTLYDDVVGRIGNYPIVSVRPEWKFAGFIPFREVELNYFEHLRYKAVYLNQLLLLLDPAWQELGRWEGGRVEFSPTHAYVRLGDTATQVVSLDGSHQVTTYAHVVRPFTSQSTLAVHDHYMEEVVGEYYTDTTDASSLVTLRDTKVSSSLLTAAGDTLLVMPTPEQLGIETSRATDVLPEGVWAVYLHHNTPNGQLGIDSFLVDSTYTYLGTARPIYAPTVATWWIARSTELVLCDQQGGDVIHRVPYASVGATSRDDLTLAADTLKPYFATPRGVYRLSADTSPEPVFTFNAAQGATEETRKWALHSVLQYLEIGLDPSTTPVRDARTGKLFRIIYQVAPERYVASLGGMAAGDYGVFNASGRGILEPKYKSIVYRDGVFETWSDDLRTRQQWTLDGVQLPPKAPSQPEPPVEVWEAPRFAKARARVEAVKGRPVDFARTSEEAGWVAFTLDYTSKEMMVFSWDGKYLFRVPHFHLAANETQAQLDCGVVVGRGEHVQLLNERGQVLQDFEGSYFSAEPPTVLPKPLRSKQLRDGVHNLRLPLGWAYLSERDGPGKVVRVCGG